MKVHFLIFLTSCSAHRSPRIPESAIVEIPDVLFCVPFPTFLKVHFFEISDVWFCAQEGSGLKKTFFMTKKNLFQKPASKLTSKPASKQASKLEKVFF